MFRTFQFDPNAYQGQLADVWLAGLDDSQKQVFAELGAHPGWAVLGGVVKAKMESEFIQLSKKLMKGEVPDHEALQYQRGFFAGMKFLLDRPPRMAKKVKKESER